MLRCLELARLGAGHVAPNPMVGSVLVFEGRIIGEGYHQIYRQAHAEVNCIRSVKPEDTALIRQSIIYVSLEPCAHYGKTPPCADLIIAQGIPRVVVGCRDPFSEVNGKGIEKLRAAGVKVTVGVLEQECIRLNKRFFTFHTLHRPYVLLKWAQSANARITAGNGETRTFISNQYTNRLVHKWRSEEASILVGTRTALLDDPALTVRLWNGPQPVRLVLDKDLRLPKSLRLFDGDRQTIVFNLLRSGVEDMQADLRPMGYSEREPVLYYQLAGDSSMVNQVMLALYQLKLQSVMVEGGARLLQSFIDEGYWDEARIITNQALQISEGISAPLLPVFEMRSQETIGEDRIQYFTNPLRGQNV